MKPVSAKNKTLPLLCWLPLASLVAIELYVRNFDGWGAWASAPLFLLPLFLGIVITGWGVVQLITEYRAAATRPATVIATVVAVLPLLWLFVRRYIT